MWLLTIVLEDKWKTLAHDKPKQKAQPLFECRKWIYCAYAMWTVEQSNFSLPVVVWLTSRKAFFVYLLNDGQGCCQQHLPHGTFYAQPAAMSFIEFANVMLRDMAQRFETFLAASRITQCAKSETHVKVSVKIRHKWQQLSSRTAQFGAHDS